MSDTEINKKVKEIIIDVLFAEAHEVKDNATLRHDLWAESYDMEDLCTALEKAFELKLDPASWSKSKTVGDVIKLIKSNITSLD